MMLSMNVIHYNRVNVGIPYYACALGFASRFKRACNSLSHAVNAISRRAHNNQPLASFVSNHLPPSQFIVSVEVFCYIFHLNYLFICNRCNNILCQVAGHA